MRAAIVSSFCATIAFGCGAKELTDLDARFGGPADPVTEGDWFAPGVDYTWQWQLTVREGQPGLNTTYDVDVYDIDLFDNATDQIAALKADERRVICYFSGGSFEEWRPDAPQFDDADIGRKLDGWDGERWLDIRSEAVFDIMLTRLDLAASKGCDGVEPDNMDGFTNSSGFALNADDQLAYNRAIANAARERGLAVGLKNTGDLAAELEPYFDFSLNEECHRYEECDQLAPFTANGKPIWNAEYADEDTLQAAQALSSNVCPAARAANIRTLVLPLDLDDAFRVTCD